MEVLKLLRQELGITQQERNIKRNGCKIWKENLKTES